MEFIQTKKFILKNLNKKKTVDVISKFIYRIYLYLTISRKSKNLIFSYRPTYLHIFDLINLFF